MDGHKRCLSVLREEQGQSPEVTTQEWTLTVITSQPLAFICSPFSMMLPLETPRPFLFILAFLLLRNCVAFSEFWVSLMKEFQIGLGRKLKDKFVREKAGQRNCDTRWLPGGGTWMDWEEKPHMLSRTQVFRRLCWEGNYRAECGCPESQMQTGLGLCLVSEAETEGERRQSSAFGQA